MKYRLSASSERGSRWKRKLDALFGRPLILALATFRRKRQQPTSVDEIGLLMLAAIGDTLLASVIVHDLRRCYPNATVTAYVSKGNHGVIDLLDGFDAVIDVPIANPVRAVSLLRAKELDLLIDIGQWTRASAILASLARAKFTVGFKSPGQHRHVAYDGPVEHSNNCHEVDNFRALVARLGIESQAEPSLSATLLDDRGPPLASCYVVLHPWASGFRSEMREWAADKWVAVADYILRAGYDVLITGGSADKERADGLAARIADPSRVTVTAGRMGLRDTAVAVTHAAVVISVNTGTMHLAAMLNRPMLALHGPTNPKRWGPVGDKAQVIGPGPAEGGAYLDLGFEYPSDAPNCMDKIAVSDVINPLRSLLAANSQAARIEAEMPL